MTGSRSTAGDPATRSATIRTAVEEAGTVAASVKPDNTPEIDTRVESDARGVETDDARGIETSDADGTGVVVTTIERDTTGGLRTTVDDYVVNLAVAREIVQIANRHADATAGVSSAVAASADVTSADADDADRADTDNTQS